MATRQGSRNTEISAFAHQASRNAMSADPLIVAVPEPLPREVREYRDETTSPGAIIIYDPRLYRRIRRGRGRGGWVGWVLLSGLIALAIAALIALSRGLQAEMESSARQAKYFSSLAKDLTFRMEPGPSPSIRVPDHGPYDERLGYVGLPGYIERLSKQGFEVAAQARFSPALAEWFDRGLFTPYHEKMQSGLRIVDRHDHLLFSPIYPARVYRKFEDIPPLVLNTLLYIENRELFDPRFPQRNPAVEWDRFGLALADTFAQSLGADIDRPGGSTLATQLEKFRHSPGGRTGSGTEKLRQMGSASLRAYLGGPDTTAARRNIALAYLNSMPLAAAPGNGEVHGLGDGLWAWYGADLGTVSQSLREISANRDPLLRADQAIAYRQVLSLLLAQRRPSYFLGAGYPNLQATVDSYLRVLAHDGVIPPALRNRALRAPIRLSPPPAQPQEAFAANKTLNVLRTRLATDLGVRSLYDLDRMDLSVKSTIDNVVQQAVTQALRRLDERGQPLKAGLTGKHMLGTRDDLSRIVYSFSLYERSPRGNLLRVQTDNYNQPLDINEGIRLDLGSSAKLRTLVHYLDLIAALHKRYAGQTPEALSAASQTIDKRDRLSLWVMDYLRVHAKARLTETLSAALERKYSSSAGEGFFTGGGLHYFANFSRAGGTLTVRQALRDSVNLVFIRVMRDIVHHYLYRPGALAAQVEAPDPAQRRDYLERFADREGQVFLRRFYAKYRGKSPQDALELLTQGVYAHPARLATVYRSVYPEQDLQAFTRYLDAHLDIRGFSQDELAELYDKYSISSFNLHDRGYIARIHPLELWLVHYLVHHPKASLNEIVSASTEQRQQVYRWLFKSTRKHAQDQRIRTLLEIEAFAEIHRAWQRLGYPFETLTPSYATAIGASGDRPAALAELVGVLLNNGIRYPRARFDSVHFAAGTPYETVMTRAENRGERVLAPEVAAAARSAMIDVVEAGTARKLKGVYRGTDGKPLVVGGKTGTGDHRREVFGAHGHRIASQVISRAGTFAFFLGDRFYGAITAYVTGPQAARYHFTSALPVSVLKDLEPNLRPLIGGSYAEAKAPVATQTGKRTLRGVKPALKQRGERSRKGLPVPLKRIRPSAIDLSNIF